MTRKSLPKGWRLVEFGDLVRKVNNRVDPESSGISRYVAGEHMDSDNLSITRWGIVGDGYLGPAFTMRFQPGHVLYGSRRTYLRKVALADFEGICANTTFVLETKSDDLLQEFLPHVMSTERFHEHSISKSKGSVNPYINFVDLNDYEFALPPVAEQHRIINLIGHLDNSVSCENDSLVSLESLRLAIVKQATDKAVEAGQMKNFGEVADWFAGGTPRASERTFYDNGTIPWATIGDIDGRTISSTSSLITEDALSSIGGRLAPVGSILVSMYGTVGKAALVEQPMATNQAIAWAEPDQDQIIPEFLLAVLGLNEKKISELARGATQQNINRAILRSVNFGCPTLNSQINAVARLNSIERVLFNVMKNLNNKRKLRSALLSNYEDVVSANV